jgi:hypothetical protein
VPSDAAFYSNKKSEEGAQTKGVVGNIIDWITDTARRPNRVLALRAAVTIIDTLIGRREATPTTQLYAVTLAPTGSGKQHALNCLNRLMEEAGPGQHVGPGRSEVMLASHATTAAMTAASMAIGATRALVRGRRRERNPEPRRSLLIGLNAEPHRHNWAGANAGPFFDGDQKGKIAKVAPKDEIVKSGVGA